MSPKAEAKSGCWRLFRMGRCALVRPAMLGKVNRVSVGIVNPEFRFPVGRPFFNVYGCAPLLAHRNQGIDAVHLETEMIDPLLEMIALDFPFGADGNDRQVQMTVRQIRGSPHSFDDLEAER